MSRRTIQRHARRFAEQVALGYVPRVALTLRGYARMSEHEPGLYGGASFDARAIYVNPSQTLADAIDTTAHEILHLRFRSWSEGRVRRVTEAVLAGARCGPRGSRLPAEFR